MFRKTTTEWKGGMTFESDDPGGKTVIMDTEVEGSDERFGISPKAAMLSALASCSGLDVVSVLEKMKVTDYEFKIDVEGELTQEHPKYFHKVKIDYHFTGKGLNENKIKNEKKCSMLSETRILVLLNNIQTISS